MTEEHSLLGTKRLTAGFWWGVVATIPMSVLMFLGLITGISPISRPIPEEVVIAVFGEGLPRPLILLLAAGSQLAYGGFWGAVLAALTRPATIWAGIALGVFLWFVVQGAVLPFLGWGVFGVTVDPRAAVATLILHLVYGATLGWLLDRER
jgi:uncharacterized protein DUF6789